MSGSLIVGIFVQDFLAPTSISSLIPSISTSQETRCLCWGLRRLRTGDSFGSSCLGVSSGFGRETDRRKSSLNLSAPVDASLALDSSASASWSARNLANVCSWHWSWPWGILNETRCFGLSSSVVGPWFRTDWHESPNTSCSPPEKVYIETSWSWDIFSLSSSDVDPCFRIDWHDSSETSCSLPPKVYIESSLSWCFSFCGQGSSNASVDVYTVISRSCRFSPPPFSWLVCEGGESLLGTASAESMVVSDTNVSKLFSNKCCPFSPTFALIFSPVNLHFDISQSCRSTPPLSWLVSREEEPLLDEESAHSVPCDANVYKLKLLSSNCRLFSLTFALILPLLLELDSLRCWSVSFSQTTFPFFSLGALISLSLFRLDSFCWWSLSFSQTAFPLLFFSLSLGALISLPLLRLDSLCWWSRSSSKTFSLLFFPLSLGVDSTISLSDIIISISSSSSSKTASSWLHVTILTYLAQWVIGNFLVDPRTLTVNASVASGPFSFVFRVAYVHILSDLLIHTASPSRRRAILIRESAREEGASISEGCATCPSENCRLRRGRLFKEVILLDRRCSDLGPDGWGTAEPCPKPADQRSNASVSFCRSTSFSSDDLLDDDTDFRSFRVCFLDSSFGYFPFRSSSISATRRSSDFAAIFMSRMSHSGHCSSLSSATSGWTSQ